MPSVFYDHCELDTFGTTGHVESDLEEDFGALYVGHVGCVFEFTRALDDDEMDNFLDILINAVADKENLSQAEIDWIAQIQQQINDLH